jgi:Domain of unknown function (DUF4160)
MTCMRRRWFRTPANSACETSSGPNPRLEIRHERGVESDGSEASEAAGCYSGKGNEWNHRGSFMPTILLLRGWRVYFYSNEGKEPLHVHARKAESECKFWLDPEVYEIEEAWSYNLTPALRRKCARSSSTIST